MDLPDFDVERFFAAHEFSARRLLSSSDCEAISVRELLISASDDLMRRWDGLKLGYTHCRGDLELRKEITRLYDDLDVEQVLEVVPEEGILLAMTALCRPGDRVIAMFPAYQSLYEIARSRDCQVSFWSPSEEPDWSFSVTELERLVQEQHPRLVVLNFPHNPTGWVPTREEFRVIVDAVRDAGAWLFSDEIYRFLERRPRETLPSALDLYDRAVALGGLSKAFGAPGLRVGWLASRDEQILKRLSELKDYTTICGSAPSEILATAVLRSRQSLLARNRALLEENLDRLDGFLEEHPGFLRWCRPPGGSVGLARLLIEEGAEEFCQRLIQENGIMMLPSTKFHFGDRHVRLGFGRQDFGTGLDELSAWLRGGRLAPAPHVKARS